MLEDIIFPLKKNDLSFEKLLAARLLEKIHPRIIKTMLILMNLSQE